MILITTLEANRFFVQNLDAGIAPPNSQTGISTVIRTQCDGCFREYKLDDKYAGKTIRCKDCGKAFKVSPGDDELPDLDVEQTAPPIRAPRSGAGKGSRPAKRTASRAQKNVASGSGSRIWLWIGGGVLAMLLLCCGGVGLVVTKVRNAVVQASTPDLSLGDPSGPFPLVDVPLPEFPPLGTPSALGAGISVYDVDLASIRANDTAPGKRMQLRVYLPPGEHPLGTLPCVLVAPAGSTLLSGMPLDGEDYHDETLPYAEAGMAVVAYSLDGSPEAITEQPELMREAYLQFRAARAGVVNGRNALEFVLTQLPQVDPRQIFAAGHSSAATLALLMAAHEPRLRGALAYAPATDLEARMGTDAAENPLLGLAFPGFSDFLKQSSPKTHVARMNCPVFLFHARDDSNEPFRTTEAFAGLLQSRDKSCTFSVAESGDHYDSMITEGIPRGIEWIKRSVEAP